MTDLRNAVEDRPSQYNTPSYGANEASFGTRHAGYSNTPSAAPMPATEYYQSRWDQLKEQSWFPMAVVGGVVLVFALFLAYAYNQGASQSTPNGTAPVIAASTEPFKVAPADAGGMVVPNQDTLVFDQIAKPVDGTTETAATENLIPPPEAPLVTAADAAVVTPPTVAPTTAVAEPQPAPATTVAAMTGGETIKPVPPAPATTTATTTTTVTTAATTAVVAPKIVPATAQPKPTAVAPTVVAPKPAPTPTPVAQTKPATLPPVANAPSKPAPVATSVVSSGTAKVQLGAFGSEAAAKAAWAKFQQKYATQLGGVTPNFVRADLGAKGVLYRVQGVGLSATSASSICQAINAQQAGGCIVAK